MRDNEKTGGEEMVYDAIVVGLGGVGSFALRSLVRGKEGRDNSNSGSSGNDEDSSSGSGLRVLGLERFHIGHELGSSHGSTRLFRHAYFEHPNYVPLCLRSTETFRELSDWKRKKATETREDKDVPMPLPLLEDCGVLVVSDGGTSGSYEVIERCAESARIFGLPVKTMETSELREEYGSCFHIPPENDETSLKGLLEEGAGFVRPELAVQYAIEDALCHGAEIVEGVVVKEIRELKEEGAPIYAIETSDGNAYLSRGVVISAGAWASKLIPELDSFLTVTRQVQAWFELSPPSEEKKTNSSTTKAQSSLSAKTALPPVGWFLDRAKDEIPIYGIPADPLSEHPTWSKIALHGRRVPFDPDSFDGEAAGDNGEPLQRPGVTEQELDELRNTVRDWIPGAETGIVRAKACLYTMTPDEHFVVDRCCEMAGKNHRSGNDDGSTEGRPSNVWYAAGLSGHGFKMTPALGEALADLVVSGETDLPVDFLKKDRLLQDDEKKQQSS